MSTYLPSFRRSTASSMLLALWVVIMLSLPFVENLLGTEAFITGVSVSVLAQAATVLFMLGRHWGFKRAATAFLITASLAYLAEWIGSHTGIPFGKYHYTSLLQPQVNGVPLLIPLAWMMMLPPAWAVARWITGSDGRKWPFVFIAALAFTAWDLFLDPQMVRFGFWVWDQPGEYFGIPLVNYLGWWLVSALITFAVNPKSLPTGPLMLVYTITWLLQSVGQALFWAQPGPALTGFLGAGLFVAIAWIRSRHDTESL